LTNLIHYNYAGLVIRVLYKCRLGFVCNFSWCWIVVRGSRFDF